MGLILLYITNILVSRDIEGQMNKNELIHKTNFRLSVFYDRTLVFAELKRLNRVN